MTLFDVAWLVIFGGGLVAFGVFEGLAVVRRDWRGTASAHIRAWLGIDPPKRWRRAASALFVAFCLWLAIHIVWGVLP